jgi:hypothetical protein
MREVNSPAPARSNLVRTVPRIPISTTKDIQKLPRHTSSFLVAGRHSLGFRRERIVRDGSSFIDAEGSALGLCNQRRRYLGLRPKCLICGDDVFTFFHALPTGGQPVWPQCHVTLKRSRD